MFEVKKGKRIVFGKNIKTYIRDILSCNELLVEAGTNGHQGGDTGHGSRTYFRVEDFGGTDIEVNAIYHKGDEGIARGFEVSLGGDCELDTIIKALKFIINVLEDEIKEAAI